MGRPGWDDYFMKLAEDVSTRSTCIRRSVGAIIVKDKRILSTGYNGAPTDISHCTEETCLRTKFNVPSGERHELCRGLHAEQNAIIQAAYHGVSIKDATIYITHQPCSICTKMLINAGIRTIICKSPYRDPLADEMINESGIELILIGDTKKK
ncbi:MAG TPA: cytidine/deoxycytidylate deaminase family protein [Spirochaetota bacterium]|nr:cytidine/deoxycytidylate deaminase family protein [Spirochaetota bacterium]HPC40817.1 cytidine/deoxycytidylate deaminase family protein [Spirochaetota bacterium]HPL18380.1 cytidine/deoxycytidylate deaminase family protein [Spirochaetota bacterium]HQF07793.1 cytidine/deoxycytidylate deaminase family protein [Spirochaetota bacterium]HQH96846.1 cytidine/deoxycytidylate deaminase family protein [Spirochaetota bacterium]